MLHLVIFEPKGMWANGVDTYEAETSADSNSLNLILLSLLLFFTRLLVLMFGGTSKELCVVRWP